jgi:molybdopterin/thiamine biosynthesis adenylyltransferase
MRDAALGQLEFLDFEEDRYAALKLIDWFDFKRVQRAKMLVIGAGAIGNEVLKNLALLGVGNIFIYDRDTIEMSNLTRSILFRASDRDQLKAETAARALVAINPDINVQWQNGDIRFDLGLGLIRRMDVVIGCLDNREARWSINGKCYRVSRPWVDAGIGQLNGQVRVYQPPEGACYECPFTADDYQQAVAPCNRLASLYTSQGKIPTTPTIASIVAGVQVQEALKLLAYDDWHGRTLVGQQFTYNGTVEDVSIAMLSRRADCPAHRTLEAELIVELPAATAAQTTFGQLMSAAQERLGAGATLLLNFDLALGVSCSYCRQRRELLRPVGKLFQEDLRCPRCAREGMLDPMNDLTARVNEAQAHYATLRDLPLAAINIPPLDILTGIGADGSKAHFELTGDKDKLLGAFNN